MTVLREINDYKELEPVDSARFSRKQVYLVIVLAIINLNVGLVYR
jgi:hypothetical protein